ncbi:Rha family transcriptional regulator [Planococcus sp. SE5232]|uniref:Rha family transcriptional regulator n=1 Tax=unclassified Planococcus (in: firmicutes) TaxID=2662419 RepID=UPI003D6AB52B
MPYLKVISLEGRLVTESREVANMTGKEHKELMRSIRHYSGILTSANMRSSEFFIPHYYEDAKKEQRPCFLLTKKGCDMVANKMTGERGILFTAEYVTRFDEMAMAAQSPKILSEKEQLMASMKLSLETADQIEVVRKEISEVRHFAENQITLAHGEQRRLQIAVSKRVYQLEGDPLLRPKLFGELYREIKDRFAVASYKDVKRKELQSVLRYVNAWMPRKVS